MKILFVTCMLGLGLASTAVAQSEEEMAQANNPLAGAYAFNLQNYCATSLYGVPD